MKDVQIKSRENIRERGEVFTAEREVKAMCDLIGRDIADIEKRVLEPAAGNGNFLVEILQRRIAYVTERYIKNDQWFCFLVALSNIYAIELCEENVVEAKRRLKDLMLKAVTNPAYSYITAIDVILDTNIIHGNFFTEKKNAILIYEYVPNYENWTFDITLHTLYEVKQMAKRYTANVAPCAIGGLVTWLNILKSQTRHKSLVQLSLFPDITSCI